jgi:hypothetical protein
MELTEPCGVSPAQTHLAALAAPNLMTGPLPPVA